LLDTSSIDAKKVAIFDRFFVYRLAAMNRVARSHDPTWLENGFVQVSVVI